MVKFLLPLAAILILASCGNDSQFDGFTRAKETGLHYKFFKHDENGRQVDTGMGLVLSYKISTYPKDSVLVDSRKMTPDGSPYTRFQLAAVSFKGSFEDGFRMMHQGDSAAFIVSADSFFLKSMGRPDLPPGVNPGSFIKGIFFIKEVNTRAEVQKEMEQKRAEYEQKMKDAEQGETAAREKYLADNKITAKPTASGLIYVELKKGKGGNPKPTDMVKVHYVGTLLDGTKFDASLDHQKEPVEFPLNQVIPAWTEGVGMMQKGGKAKLIVPSAIGYGSRGQGPIPPFSTLVFEVELVDFAPGPDMTGMQQMPQQQGGQEQHHAGDGHNH
jgi:FKBP-type peptidyl-prolyl cis-trans isomerase FkpA